MNRLEVDALGEIFLRLPFLRALREWAPAAKITILPGIGGKPYWEDHVRPLVEPLVDEVIRLGIPWKRRFDWVFDMEGHPPMSICLRILARKSFHTVAWRGWLNFPHRPVYYGNHITKRYLGVLGQATSGEAGASPWPWPLPSQYRKAAKQLLPAGHEYVAFAPGAGTQGTGKCWPIERYVEVVRHQARLGRVSVLLLGHGEVGWDKYFAGIPSVVFPLRDNDCGKSGVPSDPVLTTAIAERVRVAVSNCCGTGHMLALGGAPVVTLFGPSSEQKFHPFARDWLRLHSAKPRGRDITGISIDKVIEAVEELWARNQPMFSTTADVSQP